MAFWALVVVTVDGAVEEGAWRVVEEEEGGGCCVAVEDVIVDILGGSLLW